MTLEFLASAGLVAVTLTGAGWLLKLEWDRARCAYLVFESAHARLSGRTGLGVHPEISVKEDGVLVHAEGRCGSAEAVIDLPRLEPGS